MRQLGISNSFYREAISVRKMFLLIALTAVGMFNNAASGQCELQTIWSPDGGQDHEFGNSVAGSSTLEVIVVSEFGNNNYTGKVYIYGISDSQWQLEEVFFAADGPQLGSQFGKVVDMSADGKTVIISELKDANNGLTKAGAAWVYVEEGGKWEVQQKLTASDAEDGWFFGEQLALSADGNVAAISATGAPGDPVYVFTREGDSWTEAQKLVGDGSLGLPWVDVSADGTVIAVGDDGDCEMGESTGAAHIFVRDSDKGSWLYRQKLFASDPEIESNFGRSVSLSATGDTLIAGAIDASGENMVDSGAVYVFERQGHLWFEQVKLVASDAQSQDHFGATNKLTPDGQRAVIKSGNNSAYVFDYLNGEWIEAMRLTASDPNVVGIGRAIALTDDGSTALLGAPNAKVDGVFWYGAAVLFDLTTACPGPGDFNAFRGFYVSGDLDSLLASDDDKLCYNPGIVLNQTEAPITLDFTGTLPNDSPASLDVTIESSANTVGLELTFSFWNFSTESWDVVGVEEQTFVVDTVRTFAGTPADHVEAGTGAVRTRYEVRVVSFIFQFPWLDCVDHVFWTTS